MLLSSLEDDRAVEEALASKGKQQEELIGKMLEEEKYQREAFQALLLQQVNKLVQGSGAPGRLLHLDIFFYI